MKEKHLTSHQQNLQLLMIAMYKAKKNLNPEFMKDIFLKNRSNCNLRHNNHLQLPKVMTARHSIENIMHISYVLWSSLPKESKSSSTLLEFKEPIILWKGNTYNCRFCKTFMMGVGFLQIPNCSICN